MRHALPLLLVVLATPGLGRAQSAGATPPDEAALSRRTQGLSRTIMSPFCPGKTIDSCPSPRAQAWREEIRGWLAEGASAEEITARLQARAPGFDLSGRPGAGWDWALPVGAMALATLWLLLYLRRLRTGEAGPRRESHTTASRPKRLEALDARLDEELARLEG
jgi:cytochrome c-type biogenesis protein CcmH/NrfF